MGVSPVLEFTILGCGSSSGVPRPNGDWGQCDPNDKKNRRLRPALMIKKIGANRATTTVVIDTGVDFAQQMLASQVQHLDGVIYSHAHADHTHGIDDLRSYALAQKMRLPIYASREVLQHLQDSFSYCFLQKPGSGYPPILKTEEISAQKEFVVGGAGGEISFLPLLQQHGNVKSLGFRIGKVAYCTDVNDFLPESLPHLKGLDVLIIDALQYKKHPSHFSLEEALSWIEKLEPKKAFLTHMHAALEYKTLKKILPAHVEPAYDGLQFEIAVL